MNSRGYEGSGKSKNIKQSRNTCMQAQGRERYSSYSYTTSGLDAGE
jgi:hypothetical protein